MTRAAAGALPRTLRQADASRKWDIGQRDAALAVRVN